MDEGGKKKSASQLPRLILSLTMCVDQCVCHKLSLVLCHVFNYSSCFFTDYGIDLSGHWSTNGVHLSCVSAVFLFIVFY